MNLYLLSYNNYFNRVIKQEDTLNDYLVKAEYGIVNATNFNPNDGVDTEHIINWDKDFTPDYILVVENNEISSRWFITEWVRTRGKQYRATLKRDVVADNYNIILNAPCFVEKGTIKDLQSPLVFNKDSEGLNQIKTKEILLQDKSHTPWIVGYIAKNASVNETTITYKTPDDIIDISAASLSDWEYNQYNINNPFKTMNSFYWTVKWDKLYTFIPGFYNVYNEFGFIQRDGSTSGNHIWQLGQEEAGALRTTSYTWDYKRGEEILRKISAQYKIKGPDIYKSYLETAVGSHTNEERLAFARYDGKTVRFLDGKVYKIEIKYKEISKEYNKNVTSFNEWVDLHNLWKHTIWDMGPGIWDEGHNTINQRSIVANYFIDSLYLVANEITNLEVTTQIPQTRNKTQDALYDIFCMPYNPKGEEVVIKQWNSNKTQKSVLFTTNSALQLATATKIGEALGSGSTNTGLYDLQILPYCPIQELINGNDIVIPYDKEHKAYEFIKNNNLNYGIILFAESSNITFDIGNILQIDRPTKEVEYTQHFEEAQEDITIESGVGSIIASLPYDWPPNPTVTDLEIEDIDVSSVVASRDPYDYKKLNITFTTTKEDGEYRTSYKFDYSWTSTEYVNSPVFDLKMDSETKLYRLCSPNYSGNFDFSLAKNGGNCYGFNVDMTFKPYNPYIKVNPNFKYLYGGDFNDSRGLICNGDFSLGQLSSAFETYELQNKNYEQIFNREIQNMDVNNKENQYRNIAGIGTSITKGAIGGAIAGANPATIALGAGTGLASGLTNFSSSARTYQENRDFKIDMYNYNLQNIQALPYGLTKCSALTYNNKLFPFIEVYECTDKEKAILENKLKYNGMTVMCIGKISDYIDTDKTFIKGQMIRLDELQDDAHMANTIYEEINKGVYL